MNENGTDSRTHAAMRTFLLFDSSVIRHPRSSRLILRAGDVFGARCVSSYSSPLSSSPLIATLQQNEFRDLVTSLLLLLLLLVMKINVFFIIDY